MKKILRFIIVGALIVACKSEGDVEPAKEKTFVRYLGSENNNVAVLAQESSDGGLTLLSYSEISTPTFGEVNYQIKLTHLDSYGNWLWEKNYPESPSDPAIRYHMKASSFIELSNSGYLIVGEGINANGTTKIQLILVDANGENPIYNSISDVTSTVSLSGSAVVEDQASGDFIVLGKIANDGANDMYVSRIYGQMLMTDRLNSDGLHSDDLIETQTFKPFSWTRKYGAGLSSLINRIYKKNSTNNYFWCGSVQNSATLKNDIRLVRLEEDSQVPPIGNPIGDASLDENGFDFCETIGGWGITGSTADPSNPANINGNIYVLKISNNADILFKTEIKGLEPDVDLKDAGASIASTNDAGFVVLGNAGTTLKNDDLLVVKINASGLEEWRHNYGSTDKQEGASIRVTSDGSYLVFATTYFGNVKKLMLMKLNKDGKL